MPTDRNVKVRLTADPSGFIAGMRAAKAAVGDLRHEIDTTNDRTAWLAQSFLALGPALGPLGAAAVPALAGLTTQMVAVGLAAGTMTIAFNGVGDALKALNDYQIDPTDAHLKKLHETMAFIGPTGRDLVRVLDEMRNGFISISNLSRDKMFPGVIEGLEELDSLGPKVEQIVAKTATAIGRLADTAGEGISGDGFADFFDFLEGDGVRTFDAVARSIGNVIEGLGAMLVAFAPLSRDFTGGMLAMTRSFAEWAHGLRDNSSFQDFIDYVRENTPRVMDLIGQLAGTFASIVEAGAPVGEVMIPLLTTILNLVEGLVDSPLGPIFIAAAAAMSVYGRAVALASISTGGLGGKALNSALGIDKIKASMKGFEAETVVASAATKKLGDNLNVGLSRNAKRAQVALDATRVKAQALTSAISVATAEAAFSGPSISKSFAPVDAALTATSAKARILGADLERNRIRMSTPTSVKSLIMLESSLGAADVQAKNLSRDLGVVATQSNQLTYAGKNVSAFGADLSKTDAAAKRTTGNIRGLGKALGPAGVSAGIFALAMSPIPDKLGLANTEFGAMAGTLGGPVGAAFGAAAGFAVDLSLKYFDLATSTKTFSEETEGLAATLNQETGEVTKNTEEYVRNKFAKDGVLDAARLLGVSSDQLVDAYLGDELAIYRVTQALEAGLNPALLDAEGRSTLNAQETDKYRGAIELLSSALGVGETALDQARDGMILTGGEVDTTREKFKKATVEVDLFTQAVGRLDEKMSRRSNWSAYQAALDNLAKGFRDDENGTALGFLSDKGRANNANLDAFVNSVKEVAKTLGPQARVDYLKSVMQNFDRVTEKAGLSQAQIKRLKEDLGLLSLKKATPSVKVGGVDVAKTKVDSLERGLINLNGVVARPKVLIGIARDSGINFGAGPGFAGGGYTGNAPPSQPAGIVHGREFVFDAKSTEGNVGMLSALQNHLRGYAGGGYVEPARMVPTQTVSAGWSKEDLDYVASVLSEMRPMYGNQYVSPHDYNQFRAEQDRDRVAATGDGWRK